MRRDVVKDLAAAFDSITVVLEVFRQRHHIGHVLAKVGRQIVDLCGIRTQARHQARPCRTAATGVVELREAQPSLGERVDVRRRYPAAITTDIRIAHVVGQNQYDIRLRFCFGTSEGITCQQ